MATSKLKTSAAINQDDDKLDESEDVCPECGSEMEDEMCPECDIIDDLDEKSPTESDEDWVQ